MDDAERQEIARRNTAIVQAAIDAGMAELDPVSLGLTPHPMDGCYPCNAITLPAEDWEN